jgi:cytochrome P450
MNASEEDRLPDDELLGQIATFVFAATDTTSNALARTLEILGRHPDAQEKLRQEVTHAYEEHGDVLDFDTIMALPYLDAVCRETLRL